MGSILPAPSVLAEEVRDATLAQVAANYGVTTGGIIRRLNRYGYTQAGNIQTAKPPPRPTRAATIGADDLEGALCRKDDPEVWFSDATLLAKYVCKGDVGRNIAGCPVRQQCLEGALDRREEYGVFGGLDPRERKALLKKRAGAAA
jgi:WhiB family transcriptional regulator, redox-sensing transcriptional regulator